MKQTFNLEFYGKEITVEVNELAKQTNGAALIKYGDTVVLSVAVMSDNAIDADFFPLMVQYYEKLYSVGKIPGGFIKREGKPTDNATLTARLIDRPLRPMFPDGFRNEIQVINEVLSVDQNNSPEIMAMLGSSLSLHISDIPFDGPIAGVIVGRINNEFIINPSTDQIEESDLHLTVAGTKEAINMVEAHGQEISEEDMVEALMFGHDAIKKLITFQEEIRNAVGIEKKEVILKEVDVVTKDYIYNKYRIEMTKALTTKDKLEKYRNIDLVKTSILENESAEYDEKTLKKVAHDLEADIVRELIINDKIRPDGRKMDEIRPLSMYTDLLPRVHGSAVFTRGQTQVLAATTLGALGEHQILDGLGIEDTKRFMLHYNFPQFSVGETGRYGPPGRREIGHGALGEKALLQVIPSEEEFPYTIRVVGEVLESNGSSSQATICAGCLSLMAAGVPIKAPVAGIAMGLITDEKNYTILTDIQGLEDHMGDMDFKVAGTEKGICAIQMDIKIKGVTKQILTEALDQAKTARKKILKEMNACLSKPREEVSKYAPKTVQFKIAPAKIKDVIGRGGEMITKIILESSNVELVSDKNAVKVDLEDDGRVIIYHTDKEVIEKTRKRIEDLTREVEKDKDYEGRVVKVEDFGCFVELWPGCEGLVHVSQIAHERVENPKDVLKENQTVKVKSLGFDQKGRLNLSMKALIEKPKKEEQDK